MRYLFMHFCQWKPRLRLAATCSEFQLCRADTLLITHVESRDVTIVPVMSEIVQADFPDKFAFVEEDFCLPSESRYIFDAERGEIV